MSRLTILTSFLIIYMIYFKKYKNFRQNRETLKNQEEEKQNLNITLEQEKKKLLKTRLERISNLVKETIDYIEKTVSKRFKAREAQTAKKLEEEKLIKKARNYYNNYITGLKSAIPKSEEELIQDIKNLEEAIEKLESYDISYYDSESTEINVGIGMFYERMSRELNSIIKEQNLNAIPIIPVQRLKYYTFTKTKSIKDKDFLPILVLMKDTGLISDIIEINSTLYIIIPLEQTIKFSNSEKVVLSFTYEEENFNIQRLLELSNWDFKYANKIIHNLAEKNIIIREQENIFVRGFESYEERQKWNKTIEEHLSREKEKEELKLTKQIELRNKLKSSLKQIKTERSNLSELINESVEIDEIDNLKEKLEPKIQFKEKPKVKVLPLTKKFSSQSEFENLKLPLDFEILHEEVLDIKENISQRVLGFHEKFSVVNGGFSQYEQIKDFIYQDMGSISEDILKEVLNNLIELKLIFKLLKIGKEIFYLFKEIEFSNSELDFIIFALNKNPLKKTDFENGLNWKEEIVLETMKSLQNKKIMRIESDRIIIPGIIQKI